MNKKRNRTATLSFFINLLMFGIFAAVRVFVNHHEPEDVLAPRNLAFGVHLAALFAVMVWFSMGPSDRSRDIGGSNRPGIDGGSQPTENDSHGSTEEVPRGTPGAGDQDGRGSSV